MVNLNFKQWLNEVWDRRISGDFGSCDVFRNPDKEELLMAIEEDWEIQKRERGMNISNQTWQGVARGWLARDGDIYVWADNAFSHDQVARKVFSDPYKSVVAFYIYRNHDEGDKLELTISEFSTAVEDPRGILLSSPNYCKMMEYQYPL